MNFKQYLSEATETDDQAYEMAWALFADAFDTINEDKKRILKYVVSQRDIRDSIKQFLESKGVVIPKPELTTIGKNLIKAINDKWKGKLTVGELLDNFPDVAVSLALVSQGQGVAPSDDNNVKKYLDEKGVSDHNLNLNSFGDEIFVLAEDIFTDLLKGE